jgi:hypothetical protein
MPPASEGGFSPPEPLLPPPYAPLSFGISFSVSVSPADLASISSVNFGAAALAATQAALQGRASGSANILVMISDTHRIGMSIGALNMNVPSNQSAVIDGVVGGLCAGLVGTCDVVSIAAQRRRALSSAQRALSSHNATPAQPPAATPVLLEAQRTYDYAASASQTNLSATSSERFAAVMASLGVTVLSVELTALSVTITVTEMGPVTQSYLAYTLGGGAIAEGFATQLPSLSLNVSALVTIAPPLPMPALPQEVNLSTDVLVPVTASLSSSIGSDSASVTFVVITVVIVVFSAATLVLLLIRSGIFIRRARAKPHEKRGAKPSFVAITHTMTTSSSTSSTVMMDEKDQPQIEMSLDFITRAKPDSPGKRMKPSCVVILQTPPNSPPNSPTSRRALAFGAAQAINTGSESVALAVAPTRLPESSLTAATSPPLLHRLSFVTPAAPATAAAPFAAAPSAAAPSAPDPIAEIRWVHRVRLVEVEVEVEEDSAAAASSKERQEAEVVSRGGAEEAHALQLIHEGSPGSSGSPQSPKSPRSARSPRTPHTAPRWSPAANEHDHPAAVAEPPRPGHQQPKLTRITSFA